MTKLHVDEDLYKEARNAVQNLIRKKKKAYFEEKLKANTANPKKLWETLKELGLQNNRSPSSNICLKKKDGLTFDPFAISEVFQKFYSNLASNLVDKLPAAVDKFGLHSVEVYYKNVLQLQENKFIFHAIESNSVLKPLKKVEVNKAATQFYKILYRYQSGFRKNHSTDTCFSYLTDKIQTGFDTGLLTGMILIDL